MKNILILGILILLTSCNSSVLDRPFTYERYENIDYKELYTSPELTSDELFLLNYCIIRQRDYFNYSIVGKTYREILDLSKKFKAEGLPVKVTFNEAATPDKIEQKASPENVGIIRSQKNKKRLYKTLNFNCKYANPTKKDIVLLNSSFIIKGPFDDYLTTVNYELNCIIPAKGTTSVDFIVPGKVIQNNILFEGNPFIIRTGIDSILNNVNVYPSGLSTKANGKYFKDCFFNAARLEPHNIIEFSKDLKDKDWKIVGADGKTFELNYGNSHIPDETDEVIQMR